MLKKYIKSHYFLNVINKIYSCLAGVATTAFITRYLGLDLKGEYAFVLQVVNFSMIVLDLGINQSYSYFYKSNGGKVLKLYLNLYTVQLILYSMICFPLAGVFRNDETLLGVFLLIPFAVVCRQFESTMAVENIRLKILVHMVNATLKLLLSMLLFCLKLQIGVHVIMAVLISFTIDLLTVIIYLIALRVRPTISNIDFGFIKKVLKYSWLPMLTSLLVTINYSVDVFFLKRVGDSEQLSLYTTASGIINYVWLIPDAFKEVLVSKVVRTREVKPVNQALRMSFICIMIICVGFILVGKLFIKLLYGEEFILSYSITNILIIGCFSMVFYKIIGVLLLAEGKRWFYFWALLSSAVLNVIGNAIAVPHFGMYGAAWVSVISYSLCGIVFLLYYMKSKQVGFYDLIGLEKKSE